jgi:cysteine synthase B
MYGAEIVFSPGNLGSNGAVAMARSMAERDPSVFMPFQYANPANPAAHYCGTALEILEQVPDGEVDAFVAGLGTGGTLMGCARRLREVNPDVQIIAAEPLQGDPVMGLRSLEDGYTPPILDITQLDRKVLVSNGEAVHTLRELLNEEGVFAGISAGAALAVARKTASRMDGGNVVVVFADGGSKYLSAGIYTKPEEQLEREMEERVWWCSRRRCATRSSRTPGQGCPTRPAASWPEPATASSASTRRSPTSRARSTTGSRAATRSGS